MSVTTDSIMTIPSLLEGVKMLLEKGGEVGEKDGSGAGFVIMFLVALFFVLIGGGFLLLKAHWSRLDKNRKEQKEHEKELREFQAAEKEKDRDRAERERKEDKEGREKFASRLEDSINSIRDEIKGETTAINANLRDHGDRILRLELNNNNGNT